MTIVYMHIIYMSNITELSVKDDKQPKILEGELSFFHKMGFVFVFITYSLSNFATFLLKGKNKELQEGENQ